MPDPRPPKEDASIGVASDEGAELVPYDRSARWRIHSDYYVNRGIGAWLDGEVPSAATNNYPFARQHAAVFLALARSLEGSESRGSEGVEILELAAGTGEFATLFLCALREEFGEEGRALYERTTYYCSDSSRASIGAAIQRPAMASLIAADRIVPALCDALDPAGARTLDGRPLSIAPLLILSNYLCCALPHKVLRKHGSTWLELYASSQPRFPAAQAEDGTPKDTFEDWAELVGEHAWRPVSLPELLGAPEPAQALADVTRGRARAEIAYPLGFLHSLARASELLRPGGALMFSDFPDQQCEEPIDDQVKTPVLYGQSLAHPVLFPVLTTLLRLRGEELLDNPAPEQPTRTLLIGHGAALSAQTRAAYKEHFVTTNRGSDYLDFMVVAQEAAAQKDHPRAIRFYQRCIALDPYNPEHYKSCGASCFSEEQYHAALHYFTRGAALPSSGSCDFELRIGEVYYRLGQLELAIAHVEASLREAITPIKYVALADIHRAQKDPEQARAALQEALRIAPGFPPALQRLAELQIAPARAEPGPPRT